MKKPSSIASWFIKLSPLNKVFFLYLIILVLCMMTVSIVTLTPLDGTGDRSVSLLHNHFWKSDLTIFLSLVLMCVTTLSVKARNLIDMILWLTNEMLLRFILLIVILAIRWSIGDTIGYINDQLTGTVVIAGGYYSIGLMLIMGLVLIVIQMIKYAKTSQKSTTINLAVQRNHTADGVNNGFKNLFE